MNLLGDQVRRKKSGTVKLVYGRVWGGNFTARNRRPHEKREVSEQWEVYEAH